MRTLSEYLGLSQATVSLVMNHSPSARSIPQRTRDRVFEAARKLQYRPNYFARSLRRNRSMSVAVLSPDLSEGYFTLVMNGVQQHLIRSHYFYFTANHYWRQELIEEYPRMLTERAVDGFLLLNTMVDLKVSAPAVSISARIGNANTTCVLLDHVKAAELALSHLYQLGHRRVAFMKGPAIIPDAEDRWNAILRIARQIGLPVVPELSLHLDVSSSSPEVGYTPVRELLTRTRDLTAIFCFNDIAALGAIRAIQDAGLRVPEDISVIGFDDIMSAAYHKPSLTTVRQPLLEMGHKGAEILLQRIEEPDRRFPAETLMEPELIVRESTTKAPKHARSVVRHRKTK